MILLLSCVSFAQVQDNGMVYIGDNTNLYLTSGNYNFSGNSNTTTSRTVSSFGKLVLQLGASTSGASDLHFVDGYVQSLATSFFIFPIGQSGTYAPAGILSSTNSGIVAAYNKSNPTSNGSVLDGTIGSISSVEFWEIKSSSSNAKISLTWRSSSNIGTLTNGNISNLAIAGWDGTKWIQIPSTVDFTSILGSSSSLNSGSITSDYNVVLSNYSAFTLASKGDCKPQVVSSGTTKTWNGNWSPSEPTIADPVIINSAYSGNLTCNSLTLNADITLSNGQYVEVVDNCSGTGKIIMASEASFVQRNSSAIAPKIELTKLTRIMHSYDYVYWGTPISGNFFSQLSGAQATTGASSGAFDLKYKYVSGTGGGWQTLSSVTTGSGYITRVKPVAPFITTTSADQINLKFTGTANNGDITVPIAYNALSPNGGTSHNLLANPYPCAIDGDMFLRQNSTIDGVLYVWQQSTPPGSGLATTYSQADYLVYTRAGFVVPSVVSGTFSGKIASGQGFQVKALSNGSVTFTNCMRLTGNNNNFFKNSLNNLVGNDPSDSFKLTMTGLNNVYSQILITYIPNGTLDYDRMYDAGRNSTSTAQLYSILDTDGRKLAINARPSFTTSDIVNMGVSKNNTDNETFTINIEQKTGVFENDQEVYLHDKELGIYHNFVNGGYTFSSSTTSLTTRFEIVYQANTLHNEVFLENNVIISLNNKSLTVKADEEIKTIEIFDITGKLISTYDVKSEKQFTTPFYHENGFYIAKIKLDSGIIVAKKLIN